MSLVDNQKQWWQRTRAAVAVELVAPFDLKLHYGIDRRVEVEIDGCPEVWLKAEDLEALEQFAISIVNAVQAERRRQRLEPMSELQFVDAFGSGNEGDE
jgi:hypothetical protein